MVNKQNFDNIKLHGTNVKKNIFFYILDHLSLFAVCIIIPSFTMDHNLNAFTSRPTIYPFVMPNFMQAHVIKF